MKRNPWPYAIIIYFIIFITGMVAWISFAVRNDQELVRKDYYEQEMQFQSELDRIERARNLNVRVSYDSTKNIVCIKLPNEASTASVHFYRPANAKLDKRITLALENGTQNIDVSGFNSGLWRVRLSWKANDNEYRHDETLIL
jgi:hypothetical protein